MAAGDTLPKPRGRSVDDTLRTYAMPSTGSGYLSQISCTMLGLYWQNGDRGDTIWANFSNGKEGTLWFYRSLVQVYRETGSDFLTEELGRVVFGLCQNDNREPQLALQPNGG